MPQTSLSAALTHRMNHLVARQGLIAGNIANAATPGYVAQDLQFQKLYDSNSIAMAGANIHHQKSNRSSNTGKRTTDTSNMTLNGNSVKLDEEMIKLNEVQLNYRMTTQLYSKYASMQRLALGRQQ